MPPIFNYAHYILMDEDLQKYLDHHLEGRGDQTIEAYYDWRRQVLDFDLEGQVLISYSDWTQGMIEEARENGDDERARFYEGLNRDVMWRDFKDVAEEQEAVYGADACWEAVLEDGLGGEEVGGSVRVGKKKHAEVDKEDDED